MATSVSADTGQRNVGAGTLAVERAEHDFTGHHKTERQPDPEQKKKYDVITFANVQQALQSLVNADLVAKYFRAAIE